jgi:hypothetical protein
MKTKIIIYLMLIIGFTSCKKEVDYDLLPIEPQLVLQSFISPGEDSIRLYMDYTKSYFGNEVKRNSLITNISKATITISGPSLTKSLKWSPRNRHFHLAVADMPLIENQIYTLHVTTFEGQKASAQTKIPLKIIGAELTKNVVSEKNQVQKLKINLSLKDEKGTKNYYNFRLSFSVTYTGPGFISKDERPLGQIFLDDLDDSSLIIFHSFSDEKYLSNSSGTNNPNFSSKAVYKGIFIKGTEEYYKYLKVTELNKDSSGNPFAEPTTLYTNIQGGLGVFAAYQSEIINIPY